MGRSGGEWSTHGPSLTRVVQDREEMASKLCLVALLNQGSPGGHEDLAEHEERAP